MSYFIVFILLIISIYKFDIRDEIRFKKVYFYCILIFLIAISAFSYRIGSDTIHYMEEFAERRMQYEYFIINAERQPGWLLLVSLFKLFPHPYYVFKFFFSCFINTVFLQTVEENTKYVFSAILMYFIFIYFTINFEILREALAVAFFLLSLKFLYKRNFIIYYMLLFCSIMFHVSALCLLFVPLFYLMPRKRVFFYGLIIIIMLGIFFDEQLRFLIYHIFYVDIFSEKALYYLEKENFGMTKKNIGITNYFLNLFLPIFILSCANKQNKLPKYWLCVCAYCIIYGVSIVLPIFFRFNNYFNIFYIFIFIDFISGVNFEKRLSLNSMRLIFVIGLTLFVSFKLKTHFSLIDGKNPSYVRYYPYSSIFDKTRNTKREQVFRYLNN